MTLEQAWAFVLPAVWAGGATVSIDHVNGSLIISKQNLGFAITPSSIEDESFKDRLHEQLKALDAEISKT